MKCRIMLGLMAGLSLAGCQTPFVIGPQAPAPLAATTVDDKWLDIAWKTHDAHQDAMNLYMDARPSVIGTPGMKRWADVNDAVTDALEAAELAAAAGSTTDYLKAVSDAKKALAGLKAAIASLKGQ